MTRREFLSNGIVMMGGCASASPIKSLLGARVLAKKEPTNGNPYQTSDNALIKHYDAEWNNSIGNHVETDHWRNLAAEDGQLESINNAENNDYVVLSMKDTYVEYIKAEHWAGFQMFSEGQSPSTFTAIYAMSDNSGWINCSRSNNFVFGKPLDRPNSFRLRISNWTYSMLVMNTAVSKVSSMAIFVAPDSFGIFNPQTLKWQTQSKSAYSLPKWGIGNLYNQASSPSVGAKFHCVCVYNRILTEKELQKIDAVNIKRFGQNTTIGFGL